MPKHDDDVAYRINIIIIQLLVVCSFEYVQ